jgi:glycosyltransferase involved in cell wall biosynthesis
VIANRWARGLEWVFDRLLVPDARLAWLPFAAAAARRLTAQKGIDVIFATCPPHSVAVTATVAKRVTGRPLVLDFRDDWIGVPWHDSQPRLRRKIESLMERWAVNSADRIVLVTESSRAAFVQRYPNLSPERFVFIPNGCDLSDWVARDAPDQIALADGFTIIHAGRLSDSQGYVRSPDGFFRALRELLNRGAELADHLTVGFTGRLPESYRARAAELGLSDTVRELGHLPQHEYVATLASASLLLAINYDEYATLIPGKIYEYWATGGPPVLLLSGPGAASDLVSRHRLGSVVEPYDVDGIRDAILDYLQAWRKGAPVRITRSGMERYDRRHLTQQLSAVLTSALER